MPASSSRVNHQRSVLCVLQRLTGYLKSIQRPQRGVCFQTPPEQHLLQGAFFCWRGSDRTKLVVGLKSCAQIQLVKLIFYSACGATGVRFPSEWTVTSARTSRGAENEAELQISARLSNPSLLTEGPEIWSDTYLRTPEKLLRLVITTLHRAAGSGDQPWVLHACMHIPVFKVRSTLSSVEGCAPLETGFRWCGKKEKTFFNEVLFLLIGSLMISSKWGK